MSEDVWKRHANPWGVWTRLAGRSLTMKLFATYLVLIVVTGITPGVASAGEVTESYIGPIIDAHGHLGASFDWNMIIKVMNRNKVSRQIVMARYYPAPGGSADLPGNDELALKLAQTFPGRFFPLIGMQRPELTVANKWHDPDATIEALLAQVDEKLATGRFYGIGEVIVKHFAYSSGRHAEIENPIDSTFMKRLSTLATRYDVPIVLHMEGKPALVQDFSRLLADFPHINFVWAHNCGRSKAPVIQDMLAQHANLYCDLAGMTNVGKSGYGIGWPRMEAYTALIEENGELYPQMRELYNAYPDRFILGMDVAHANGMNPGNYGRRANRFRKLLAQLKPKTAKAFAEGNAIRIFKLDNP